MPTSAPSVCLPLALAACLGCVGSIGALGSDAPPGSSGQGASSGQGSSGGGPGGASGSGGGVMFSSPVVTQQTWRLTNAEYANTTRDLLRLPAAIDFPLDPDAPAGGFRVGDQPSDNTIRTYHSAAIQLASQAVANLSTFLQANGCNPVTSDAACAGKFIDAFAPRAFRRALDPGQRAELLATYTKLAGPFDFQTGLQAVIEQVLQSPSFLYHAELEEQSRGPGLVPVTGYSMASRLSYLLWASMPDQALFAKAAAGQLATKPQIAAEVDRLLADPRARAGLRGFYEQWLDVESLPVAKNKNTVTNRDYASLYTPAVRSAIQASFEAQVDDALWAPRDSLRALLTSRTVYANGDLAPLFGVTAVGPAMQALTAPAGQRAGILTHPLIMASHATETSSHPIKRGVFVLNKILCQTLSLPAGGLPAFVLPAAGSTRDRYASITSDPARCMPCHTRINPMGFMFEAYDTIGAYRTVDDTGAPVKTDDLVVARSGDETLNKPTTSAAQLADNIAGSPLATACLVQNVYRYAAKRALLGTGDDQPVLDGLASSFTQSGQSLKQLLTALTQTDIFLYRRNVQ